MGNSESSCCGFRKDGNMNAEDAYMARKQFDLRVDRINLDSAIETLKL